MAQVRGRNGIVPKMYIKYTFVHFSILLICQILGAVPLPMTSPFAVEALNFRRGSSFGRLHRSGNLPAILVGGRFLSLALFIETSVLVKPSTFDAIS